MDNSKTATKMDRAVVLEQNSGKSGYLIVKRVQDIVLSALALVALSPLMLLIGLLVVIDDPHGGPIFSQERVGRDGQPFRMYKFRSMRLHSEKLGDSLTEGQRFQYEKEFKLDHDPRITRLGKFLRRSSLDELPQLVNIFCGQMSIVGPRPLIKAEVEEKYSSAQRTMLLSVRPGLTGLWQVSGRSGCTYESGERQQLELQYAQNISLKMDIGILLKTVGVVLRGTGI